MKSLEIVRDKLYILEKYPAKIEAIKLEKDVLINQEQLLKIEQDLEVLEIVNKLLSRIDYVDYGGTKRPCFVVNKFIETKEIEKLKQWLEGNE